MAREILTSIIVKKIIGLIAVLFSLAFIAIVTLRIWDIHILSMENIIRSSATLIVLGITIILLLVLYGGFFRNNQAGYDSKTGDRAHPKQ